MAVSIPLRRSGVTATWTAESGSNTATAKGWGNVQLSAKKLMGLVMISNELVDDAIIDVADDAMNELGYAFALEEDNAGFLGDGSATYGGIVGLGTAIGNVSSNVGLIVSTGTGFATNYNGYSLQDFENVIGATPDYVKSPAWFVNKYVYYSVMRRLVDTGSGNTNVTLTQTPNGDPMFLGFPVHFTQVLPKVSAVSQITGFFGDLSQGVVLGDRREVTVAMSDSGNGAFEADQIAIRAKERLDIVAHSPGTSTIAGPVVAFKTNAS